jgi:hypothetical protein
VYREVTDMDKLAVQFEPEFRPIAPACTKAVENLLNPMHAGRQMAPRYLSADDIGCTFKNYDPSWQGKPHRIVFIHIGNVNGQMGQHELDLLQRERPDY